MEEIREKATDLGAAIAGTQVFQDFARAQEAFRKDRRAQSLAEEVREARRFIGPIRERGRAVSLEAAADFREKLEAMHSHPRVVAFREAKEELGKFLQEVESYLHQGMGYELSDEEARL